MLKNEDYERLKVMLQNANISLETTRTLLILPEAHDPLCAIFGENVFHSVTETELDDAQLYEVVVRSQDSYEIQKQLAQCKSPCVEVLDQQYIMRDGNRTQTVDEKQIKQLVEDEDGDFESYVTVLPLPTKKARALKERCPKVIISLASKGRDIVTYKKSLEDDV